MGGSRRKVRTGGVHIKGKFYFARGCWFWDTRFLFASRDLRGLGSLKEKNGINEVQDDFVLSTAADIVSDPSAPDAFVRGIMENREWILENGIWQEREVDMAKTYISKTSARELDEAKLVVFESFMKRLSEI